MNRKVQDQYLTSEMKLLLLCAKNDLTVEQLELAQKLIRSPIDWNNFCTLAVKNRVYPVVFKNLKELDTSCVDLKVLHEIEAKCKRNQLKALGLATELIKVMGLLDQQNIKAISMKGPFLALSLYQDVSFRVSKDLDILVHSSDLEQIDRILKEAGYAEDIGTLHLSRKQLELLREKSHHISYTNHVGVQLELHWRLSDSYYSITFEEAWRNKKEVFMFGKKINVLQEEENLIYLIFHGSKHAWKRLRWLCDIYEMMKMKELDWEYIGKRSKELGVLYQLKQTEILLKRLFQYEFPIQIELGRAERITADRLAEMVIPFITAMDENTDLPGHTLFRYGKEYNYVWHKSFGKRLSYLLSILIPGIDDFESRRICDEYFFLYYIRRPFRLLKKHVKLKINKSASLDLEKS